MAYSVRNLTTYDEMLAVHQLQLEIWGQSNPSFAIYPPIMSTVAKNGGIVLGAFDDESGHMVAFLFSFLGREGNGPLKLCSQVMGVHKAWRRQGIAEALKQEQRQRAIAQGLPLITWTFDPLEGPNAHLNLHKLHAITRTYWQDVYGTNFGALNAGLPSDRLLVEWWLESAWLKQPPDTLISKIPTVFKVTGQGTLRQIISTNLALQTESVLLEIPADIQPLKATNLELAMAWRLQVREAFETYFANNYMVVDFVSQIEAGERYNYYVLRQSSPQLLADLGMM